MLLHIGGDIVVHFKEVIAIFDINIIDKSKNSREFLNVSTQNSEIIRINKEETRSLIITSKKSKSSRKGSYEVKNTIYYSPISAQTLQKRVTFIEEIEKY